MNRVWMSAYLWMFCYRTSFALRHASRIPGTQSLRATASNSNDRMRSASILFSTSKVIDVDIVDESNEDILRSRRQRSKPQDRSSQKLRADIQELIRDAQTVLLQNGNRVSIRRTITAVQALIFTGRDIVQNTGIISSGISSVTTKEYAKYLRIFFERMGATYIKLGQFIASSPTIFPGEFVKEMQRCLDSTEPVPFSTILKVIKSELGQGAISSSFKYIDPKPLASASIAQVHRAKLANGDDVVLKVQKPGTDAVLKADLGFLFLATRTLEVLQPELSRISLSSIVGDIRNSMLDELDFIKEASNVEEFRQFLQDNRIVQATCPKVYKELSTSRVLTMERLNGVSLSDIDNIKKRSLNPEATLISALNTWILSVTMCQSFHADVHAGNLLVLDDGRVGFIDFGIVGRIPASIWSAINDLTDAVVSSNYVGMAKALARMGATDAEVDVQQFAFDIEKIFKKLNRLNNEVRVVATSDDSTDTTNINAILNIEQDDITELLVDIAEAAEANGLKLPREFGLLIKQALYFDVYSNILAPQVDVLRDDRILITRGGDLRL